MGLRKRLVARLDVKGNKLIKGIRFEGLRVMGDPLTAAVQYANEGIDEILFIDAVASLYGRNSLFEILRASTRDVFVPITAGGGVRSVQDAATLLSAGADKIAVNTEAINRPLVIQEMAESFGKQCVVASVQARRIDSSSWEAMSEAGRERSGKDVVQWVQYLERIGAGEILLTSVDSDGTCKSPDVKLIESVARVVNIPLVVGGGFSNCQDIDKALSIEQISAVSIGASLHKSKLSIPMLKHQLGNSNYSIRPYSDLPPILNFHHQSEQPIKIGIIDYGMGNQQSLFNALVKLGFTVVLSSQIDELAESNLLALPGVGAFPEGMKQLRNRSLDAFVKTWAQARKPLIGICLGMQMLFEFSDEFEKTSGLALIPGEVKKIAATDVLDSSKQLPLPHMGWNSIIRDQSTNMPWIDQFFVHSYSANNVPEALIETTAFYGSLELTASVRSGNIVGFQFHPERSGSNGLKLLLDTINNLVLGGTE